MVLYPEMAKDEPEVTRVRIAYTEIVETMERVLPLMTPGTHDRAYLERCVRSLRKLIST